MIPVRRYKPKTKPFKHQSASTIRALKQRNLAFLMEPGCAKTKAVLDTIAIHRLKGRVERVLVLAPLSALSVWEDEISIHYPFRARVEDLDYRWTLNKELEGPEVEFFLCHYEMVSRRAKKRGGKLVYQGYRDAADNKVSLSEIPGNWYYPTVKALQAFNPDLIVLDESHRCKRAGSNRARSLWRMVKRLRERRGDGRPWVILMTGTPNPKGYLDLFAQYRIMDDSIFGTSKAGFEERYCRYGHGRNKYRIIGYANKAELVQKIRDHAFIISKDRALDLPEELWQNIPVKLPQKARELYYQMAEEMVAEWEGGTLEAANAGSRRIRLLQITGGLTTSGAVLHTAKIQAAREALEDLLDQGQQVVVYARFLAETAELERICSMVGYDCVRITGSTPASVRTDARRRFQGFEPGNLPMALVFQVATGSLAITLTAASEVLFYSLPDGWDTYYQCLARVHRAGQTKKVRYRHLVAPGTVDVTTLKALRAKADLHRELMGNMKAFLMPSSV